MKKVNIIYAVCCFAAVFCWNNIVLGQNAGLSISWNGAAYVVKMEVVTGANPLLLGSSQVSIVTPAAMSTAGITVNCAAPCGSSQWNANTFVNAPSAAPGSNFVAIASLGGNMGNVVAGTSVTLFTFTLVGGCDPNVRLFANGSDPSSAQMPSGQDFGNNLNNGLSNTEFYNGSNNNGVVCIPAPLDLLRFVAQPEGRNVRLLWATENETDMDYFELQRSVDGVHFDSIATQTALNQPSARYEYLDERVPEASIVYYRLEQFEKNGARSFGPVRSVRFPQARIRLALTPNPAWRSVVVSVAVPDEITVSLQVMNAAGAVLYSQRHELAKGENVITLAVTDWPEGTYVVSLLSGTERLEQRLVVQH